LYWHRIAAITHESDRDPLKPGFEQRFHIAAGALARESRLNHWRMQLSGNNRIHAYAFVRVLNRHHAR
jgi:hypothetical protein